MNSCMVLIHPNEYSRRKKRPITWVLAAMQRKHYLRFKRKERQAARLTVMCNFMKQILSILIGLLWTATVYAECAGTALWVFPSSQTIKQNTIFILDGYAESQNVILGLNKKHDIYLKSGNKKVKLIVTGIYTGQFYLTQALLKPETELVAGVEYTMFIDSLPEYDRFTRYNDKTKLYEPIKYKVVAGIDNDKPLLTSVPKEIDKSYIRFGCGPAMSVDFDFPVTDSSEVTIKTTVKNIKSRIETTYFIMPRNNQIIVGHGMCSGAFTFDESNDYEVEFSFMDSSGNQTSWVGDRIKFTKPTDKNWDVREMR